MSDRLSDKCNPHPDAPHGFDRNSSATEDRYVCDCEHWMPPDDLRIRIAAVIMESCHGVYMDDAVAAADAVIRELGLRREEQPAKTVTTSSGDPWFSMPASHRYVTDWTDDE